MNPNPIPPVAPDAPRSVPYFSMLNSAGRPMLAGAWTMRSTLGFPLESFVLECRRRDCGTDWAEAMFDAARDHGLPVFFAEAEGLLTPGQLLNLKIACERLLAFGAVDPAEQVARKWRERLRWIVPEFSSRPA